MASRRTPGKWYFEGHMIMSRTRGGKTIATIGIEGRPRGAEDEANGRLLGEADVLYEMLLEAKEKFVASGEYPDFIERAREIIRRIEPDEEEEGIN